MWDEQPAFVLDGGSGAVKCGYAGEEVPRGVFACAVGHPRGSPSGPFTVGDAAVESPGLTVRYPLENGVVRDWDALERLYHHAYTSIGAEPSQQAALLTEAPMNPKVNREKMVELMFERFGVPATYVQIQAVLSLYTVGRTDGLVLDSGDGVTHAVPVFDGHTVPTAVRRIDMAGRDLTQWMMTLLSDETGRPFTTSSDREVARGIKERLAYCALDFDAEMDIACGDDAAAAARQQQSYALPDGTSLELGRSLFCCAEAMFDPTIAERDLPGIHTMVHSSINECGIDIRRTLYQNILLAGGNTMFKGLDTRLAKEVRALANPKVRDEVKVVAPNERKFSVWMGAAVLASLASFNNEWITREEYDEHGAGIVHQRCSALGFVEQ